MVNTKGCVKLLKKILNIRENFSVRLSKKTASLFISTLEGFLENRELQILDWHFGLHGEQLSLERIGNRLKITRERVHQIEKKAIAKKLWLHRSRRWILNLFILDKNDLIGKALSLHAKNEELEAENIKLRSPAALKEMPYALIDDTELSIRTRNILRRAGIKTIGSLMQKTKRNLLTLNRMGSKSFKEIEDFLTEYGLSLKK